MPYIFHAQVPATEANFRIGGWKPFKKYPNLPYFDITHFMVVDKWDKSPCIYGVHLLKTIPSICTEHSQVYVVIIISSISQAVPLVVTTPTLLYLVYVEYVCVAGVAS
jgi:hypothetical protein